MALVVDFVCELPNGVHARPASHVEALCQAAGVDVTIEDTVLRHENHAPVHGFVVVAHKGA